MKPWCTDNLAKWEKLVRNENLRKTGQKIMTLATVDFLKIGWIYYFLLHHICPTGSPRTLDWTDNFYPRETRLKDGTYVNMTRHKDIKETLFLQDYFRSRTYCFMVRQKIFFSGCRPQKDFTSCGNQTFSGIIAFSAAKKEHYFLSSAVNYAYSLRKQVHEIATIIIVFSLLRSS